MTEPVWLSVELLIAIHDEQLREFGGPPGMRDQGLLESALGRPQNKWTYGETDLAVLAAAYAFGIARNHPFDDGNKRAAFLGLVVFLGLNDIDFIVDEAEATVIIHDLAAGLVGEEGLTRWIRDRWPASSADVSRKAPKIKAAAQTASRKGDRSRPDRQAAEKPIRKDPAGGRDRKK